MTISTQAAIIRPERSADQFSRGAECIRAILALWKSVDERRGSHPFGYLQGLNDFIDAEIGRIRDEFDLSLDEWHYWADMAASARRGW